MAYFDALISRFEVLNSYMIIQSCKQTRIIFIQLYFVKKKTFGSTLVFFAKIKVKRFWKTSIHRDLCLLRHVLVLAKHELFYDADS